MKLGRITRISEEHPTGIKPIPKPWEKAGYLNFSEPKITRDQREAMKAEIKKSQGYWYEPVGKGKYSLRDRLSPDEVVDNIIKILR